MKAPRLHALASIVLTATLLAGQAQGAMDGKAAAVAAKVLGFALPKPPAGAKIIVVGSAAALADVQAALSGFTVAAGSVADAATAYAAIVSDASEAKSVGGKVLTIGPVACVEAGACVAAIETSPKVTIYFSKTASATAGIDFDPNFKLMATAKVAEF